MKTRLHRVVIVVHDLEAGIALYERLLGATLVRTAEAVALATGVAAAADPDVGIELASPLPNASTPIASDIAAWLETHGEGVYAFGVNAPDDFEEALATARAAGLTFAMEPFSFNQEQIDHEFGGRYSRYEEAIVDRKHLGFALALNAIVNKP